MRTIARCCAPFALMLGAAAGAAEPAEPLTVTRLPDAEKLLVSTASDDKPDNDGAEFSRAVSEAVRLQQQSIRANCRSAPTESSSIAVRWAWEAHCRYQRY